MESHIEEVHYCYVGRQPGCRCLGVVVVDSQEHAKDTAKTVADAVKSGLIIERMTVEDFRNTKEALVSQTNAGGRHDPLG